VDQKSILIIGKIPPPIGGVSIHIERLLYCLKQDGLPYDCVSLKLNSFRTFISKYRKSKIVHLHISNVYLRTFLTMLSYATNKKHINTYHGNLGNKNKVKNYFDKISVRFSAYPVVLNENAKEFARKHNNDTILISAFIPPPFEDVLSESIKMNLELLRKEYKPIFCTNAFGVKYDDSGNEIYGITELINIFSDINDKALIISDPSGSYNNYLKKKAIELPKNIFLISEPHSFIEILKLSDCYIRNTTTDGDSLSVREGLFLKKPVIATNCVQRPNGVILAEVNNPADLYHKIDRLEIQDHLTEDNSVSNGYIALKQLYQTLLNQ